MHESLKSKILNGIETGLKVIHSEGKGRGVIAAQPFAHGEYVVEYCGDLISSEEAEKREYKYARDKRFGCFMYYFESRGKLLCVDATAESKHIGRLVNHSRKKSNLITKVIEINNIPHLVLLASKDIKCGQEMLYDYGERDPNVVHYNQWLKD